MQRINVEKNEAVADLIERILEVQDDEMVLIIPKGSHLMDSPSNFRLIAREASVLEKSIFIESVDQDVLAQAKSAGLSASHPLFDGHPNRDKEEQSFSDIRPRSGSAKSGNLKKLKAKPEPEPEPEPEEEMEEQEEENEPETEDRDNMDVYEREEERYDTLEPPNRRGRKVLVWGIAVLLLVVGGMWITASAFGRANVDITFDKAPWTYTGTIVAAVDSKSLNVDEATIPSEMVEQPQNLPFRSFEATGRTTGGQKSRGIITIVNEYSSASQELVATTRFTTPDGKLYRLDSGTIVPGAKVDSSGKVTESSSIKAAVTADKPGSEYNVGNVSRLNIPGFQGTAKYNGFYGVFEEGTSGGSSTGGPAPTEDDINKAKAQMAAALNSSFQATFLASVPDGFKVLPDAMVFATTTFSIGPVDEAGKFSVTPATILRAFEFREADVHEFLNAKAKAEGDDKVLQDLEIDYTNVSPDFANKELTFTVEAKGVLAPEFDQEAFMNEIAGRSQEEARQAILDLPDLSDAKVSIWPAWLWTIPQNSSKITVNVQ